MKGLKNYTTTITIEKTISEIEQLLANFGCSHIFKLYEDGMPKGLAFKMMVQGNMISFKLPMNEEKILIVFQNQVKRGKIPKSYYNNIEQARRTGWRILKDWIDSQLALLSIDLAKPEEIFLPYMYNEILDKTLFELLESKGFDNLQLEDKSNLKEKQAR